MKTATYFIPFYILLNLKKRQEMKKLIFIALLIQLPITGIVAQKNYITKKGYVSFFSQAPIADVDAQNKNVNVKLNTATNEVTVDMKMEDFEFKNRKMGRDAEKKYIETEKYPRAGFKGKINGKIDYDKPGTYPATATGKLKIHGEEKEVTEKGIVSVKKGKITLQSKFHVLLKDYNIETPEILGQKMTDDDVLVKFEATLSEEMEGREK
jgi:polyisoprenoid-binding protein YceI